MAPYPLMMDTFGFIYLLLYNQGLDGKKMEGKDILI
jgi:hypothetical protein